MMGDVTAQLADEYDPDDPVEILAILPDQYHQQFLSEYDAAVAGARRPDQYRQLHSMLRLWRLRAVAYSDPSFESRLESARTGSSDQTPIEQVVPDWDNRLAAARRRREGMQS
jgi:hypothetical protein